MFSVLHFTKRAIFPLRFSGGAERASHALLQRLVQRGVHCRAHGCMSDGVPYQLPDNERLADLGVRAVRAVGARLEFDLGYVGSLEREDVEPALRKAIARERPTHVWTHLEGSLDTVRAARREGLATLWYVHDVELDKNPANDLREAALLGTHLVACSPFVARRIKEATGVDATVVYPAVEPEAYVTERPAPEFVTMVNPVKVKGGATFTALAAALPEVKFLAVEGWPMPPALREKIRGELAALPNVTFLGSVPDMREVYRKTKLLLVPSIWEEAFCRVVLEAQASGIPVVASRRGGLADFREGVVFVDEYLDPAAWAATIAGLLSDDARMKALSAEAWRNARSDMYSVDTAADQLQALLASSGSAPSAAVEPTWIPLHLLDAPVASLVERPDR